MGGANIVGVTINHYQVQRGNEINAAQGFADRCLLKQGDFCKLSEFADNSVEKGNALPDLISDQKVLGYFKQSGFDVVYDEDLDVTSRAKGQIPWHHSMMAKCTLENFQHTRCGMGFTHCLVWILETLNLAPKGTYRTHGILRLAAEGLVKSGQNQIFTPMFLVVAQKPMEKLI